MSLLRRMEAPNENSSIEMNRSVHESRIHMNQKTEKRNHQHSQHTHVKITPNNQIPNNTKTPQPSLPEIDFGVTLT